MTINVETIGDALMVQHFVSEVRESKYCRLVSISEAITPKVRTKVQVVWELSAKKINDHTCEYSNHIHASATDEFLAFIEKNGVTFEQARLLGRRHRTLITTKKRRTLPKASNADPY